MVCHQSVLIPSVSYKDQSQQSLHHQFLRNPNHKARDNNALETDYHVRFEIDWIGMDSACFLHCNDDKLQSEILASERSCESKFWPQIGQNILQGDSFDSTSGISLL